VYACAFAHRDIPEKRRNNELLRFVAQASSVDVYHRSIKIGGSHSIGLHAAEKGDIYGMPIRRNTTG